MSQSQFTNQHSSSLRAMDQVGSGPKLLWGWGGRSCILGLGVLYVGASPRARVSVSIGGRVGISF